MKICLVSDSHGDDEILEKIAKIQPDCDLYLHAGDSQSNPYAIKPFISVKGNCDYDSNFLNCLQLSTPYGNLYIQHRPNIPSHILNDEKIKIFINGHTHQRRCEKINDQYFINPGSTTFPRDSYGPGYCILKIDTQGVDVKFHDL